MFVNLEKINLKKYLEAYQGNINKERWLIALDEFVGTLSQENLKVLQSKINPDQDFYSINNLVNEVMVACVFHPKAIFVQEGGESTCDLFEEKSNLRIEVKSLNEGDDERERHKKNEFPNGVEKILSVLEEQQLICIIKKKCTELLEKAVKQIKSQGKIYLIWDYNLYTGDNVGTKEEAKYIRYRHSELTEDKFCDLICGCVNNFANGSVLIETLFFGELQKKVAQQAKTRL